MPGDVAAAVGGCTSESVAWACGVPTIFERLGMALAALLAAELWLLGCGCGCAQFRKAQP
jgi:hypothetical protein